MYTIRRLDNISSKGLNLLPENMYQVTPELTGCDGILVRSCNMLDMELPERLKAIARAGAGVNNIPIDRCTEKGIVVFNTPGANANGVKELVLAALFLSSRKVDEGIGWAQSLKGKGEEVPKLVEKGKSKFEGPEIKGKKLGIIGLGAIGVMLANDAIALGMEVGGYDPFISVDAAWRLSKEVARETSLDHLLATSDYITIHIPQDAKTKGMLNKDRFAVIKKGARIINMARGGLVVNSDLLEAVNDGTVACYVTDFPEDELLGNDRIITIPHLGASTPESEENCAIMAVKQLKEFMEKGNIRNSVNFPECSLEMSGNTRITITNRNVPNMVGQFTTALAESSINISDILTHHKGSIGYTIIEIDGELREGVVDRIRSINGVIAVRVIGRD
jgi:D-3-phosphoglycerate dehydrogenase / 2-oxoglutarate reductase